MTHKFEEYPELSEMMQEYAAHGRFGDWQKFTDALNNALTKAENLPISDVVVSSSNICTDTGEECKHNCSGLCKERC
jgi:hypothetical protein